MTSVILIFRNNIERRKKAKNIFTQSEKWTEYQHGHNRGTVTSVSDRPENENMSADTSYVDDTSGQQWHSQYHVPLAGGATAFLRLGGGNFFSGSGFLGTTGTLKIV